MTPRTIIAITLALLAMGAAMMAIKYRNTYDQATA